MTRTEFMIKQHEAIKMIDALSDRVFESKDIGSNQKLWIGEALKEIWSKVFTDMDILHVE